MPRFVALLRGVSPMNAKMADLKKCFENAGFTNVKTVLSSGNVVFDARATSERTLERKCEMAIEKDLGRKFATLVRSQDSLIEMIESDPFGGGRIPQKAKRVVTFVRERPKQKIGLPYKSDGVQILAIEDQAVFTIYEPNPRGPVFMTLLEKTFGKDITTRTWDTVRKCAGA